MVASIGITCISRLLMGSMQLWPVAKVYVLVGHCGRALREGQYLGHVCWLVASGACMVLLLSAGAHAVTTSSWDSGTCGLRLGHLLLPHTVLSESEWRSVLIYPNSFVEREVQQHPVSKDPTSQVTQTAYFKDIPCNCIGYYLSM